MARRYVADRAVQQAERGRSYRSGEVVEDPLAAALIAVPGVARLLTLPSSITVTRTDDADWDQLDAQIIDVIESHYG